MAPDDQGGDGEDDGRGRGADQGRVDLAGAAVAVVLIGVTVLFLVRRRKH